MLKTYLKAIQNISEKDKEMRYRGALENLLNSIKPESSIEIKHEPNNDKEGRGAPDFLVTNHSLTLGYIETKRVNRDLNEVVYSEQIQKYLEINQNIIITDYLSFMRIGIDKDSKIPAGGGQNLRRLL